MSKEGFYNLIFVLFLVVIFLVAGIILSLAFGLLPLATLFSQMSYWFYSHFLNQILWVIIAALLIILAFYLIQEKRQYQREELAVSQKTSFGEVRISLNSIKHLILKVLKEIKEIKEVRPEINLQKTGEVKVNLHLGVEQDIKIPELSEKIQKKIKDYLLETSGIELKEIKIHIDKVFYEVTESKMPQQR